MKFTLDNLTDSEFENFCFDLLSSLKFVNLSWRKGTGLTSSPADQGRDIEAEVLKKDIDGIEYYEKWFVECKHYVKGVPADKIQGALAWANAERPNILLIIVSNFLSNSTKNYLDNYQKNNKPPFRIKVWELNQLENLTADNLALRRKYNLETELSFLPIINKYHLTYAVKIQLNTLSYFLELMDELEPYKRDRAFEMTYHDLIKPRFLQPISGKETLAELQIDKCDYENFKLKCLEADSNDSTTFIYGIVTSALSWLFHFADITSVYVFQERIQATLLKIDEDILTAENDEQRERYTRMKEFGIKSMETLPERTKEMYEIYEYICNNLILKLLMENPLSTKTKF